MKYLMLVFLVSCAPQSGENVVKVGRLIKSTIHEDGITFEKLCTTSQCTCSQNAGSYTATAIDCKLFDSIIKGELNHE